MRFSLQACMSAAAIVLAAVMAAPAQAQVSVYETAFDDSDGWELGNYYGVQWGVDDTPIPGYTADYCLNYNNGVDYVTGDFVYGFANSPTIDLTQASDGIIAFNCRYQTEGDYPDYDQRFLYVFDPDLGEYIGGGQFSGDGSVNFNCGGMDNWHSHIIQLDPAMVGINVQFHFYFDSIDDFLNEYQGWFIDDMIVVVPDVTPANPISDLTADNPTLTTIDVSWTSPADDDISGYTAAYDLRYSNSPITEANFDTAIQVAGEPAPDVAGTAHSMTIPALSEDTTYFFAVRSIDASGNISLISNVASASTLAPPPPPPPLDPGPGLAGPKETKDILPCSAGASPGGLTGLLALAGLVGLAAAGRSIFRK